MTTPKKNSSSVVLLLLLLVLIVPGALWGVGTYEPVKLATIQEQVLGVIKGGVGTAKEDERIEGCIELPGGGEQKRYGAVQYITRSVRFADGSTLTVTYGKPPTKNPQCP